MVLNVAVLLLNIKMKEIVMSKIKEEYLNNIPWEWED